jgi:hypothetical protein
MLLVAFLLGLSATVLSNIRAHLGVWLTFMAHSMWSVALFDFRAMAYSPCEEDDTFHTLPPNPLYSALDYTQTPGNFGHASTPSCFSPDYVPNDHLPSNCQSQPTQLVFLPIADWGEE